VEEVLLEHGDDAGGGVLDGEARMASRAAPRSREIEPPA
jgi:hypothetical protein